MNEDIDKIPFCTLYSKYLNIASFKFNISMDEARDKYGLFTIRQWNELLSDDKE